MVQEFDKVVHHENPLRNWGTWFKQVLLFPKMIAM
jgi:hypothetical protein